MLAKISYPVHPAAECFRLMTDDELAALAADIAENGQTDPVVVGRINGSDAEFLVDGRNRIKGCEIAGVEPIIERRTFKSDDEVRAFVKSRGERRDLTKGERAMSLAMLYPEPGYGRAKKDPARKSAETADFSDRRLRQARQVRRSDPDLALRVRDGVISLDEALAEVADKQKKLATADEQMARLRASASDLADLITEERMSLADAIATLDERERKADAEKKARRDVQMRLSEALYRGTLAWAVPEFVDEVKQHLADPEYHREFFERLRLNSADLDAVKAGADLFVQTMKREGTPK